MSNISYALDNLRSLVDVYDDLDANLEEFVNNTAGEIVTHLVESMVTELVMDAMMNEFDCVVRDSMAGASDLLDVDGHVRALQDDVSNVLEHEVLVTLQAEMANMNLGAM